MDAVFTKLNYKQGQTMYVLNSPDIFEDLLKTVPAEIPVIKDVNQNQPIDFIVIFGTQQIEFEKLAKTVTPLLNGDAIYWLAYPKASSKKYTCDFNRDTSWDIMAPYKMLPVRQISIDEDWSALRFRKEAFIKSAKRKPVAD